MSKTLMIVAIGVALAGCDMMTQPAGSEMADANASASAAASTTDTSTSSQTHTNDQEQSQSRDQGSN
jgi:hypothetical protein